MPYRADGYQQAYPGSYVSDSTLHDGNDVESTLNSGAGTGYGLSGGAMSNVSVSVVLDLGVGATFRKIDVVWGYKGEPLHVFEVSNDGLSWSTPAGMGQGLMIHMGFSKVFDYWTFNANQTYRYVRVSLRDSDSNGIGSQVGVYEVWARTAGGDTVPEYVYVGPPITVTPDVAHTTDIPVPPYASHAIIVTPTPAIFTATPQTPGGGMSHIATPAVPATTASVSTGIVGGCSIRVTPWLAATFSRAQVPLRGGSTTVTPAAAVARSIARTPGIRGPVIIVTPSPVSARALASEDPDLYDGGGGGTDGGTITPVMSGTLRMASCRDRQGTTWTGEVAVADADLWSAAIVRVGGCLGALYSRGAEIFWKISPNAESWAAAVETNTGIVGLVHGLACNASGVLCALSSAGVIVSRNQGATWVKTAESPGSAYRRDIVAIGHLFVIVCVDSGGVTDYVSHDGGATWK